MKSANTINSKIVCTYYVGSFNFSGKILTGEKFGIGNSGGIHFTEISENFSIAFGERKDNSFSEL